jgi:hypothetical protein
MKVLELSVVIAAAAALVGWRAWALYRQTFRRRDL